MTKSCAIPECNAGYRLSKDKRSLFRVPIDVKRYEKWAAVIPGLKQTQFVCEKHFEKQFILRHWKKFDANGRCIMQVQYMKPKLDESAVPSIFKDYEEIQSSVSRDMADEPITEVLETPPPPRETTVSDLNVTDCPVKDEPDIKCDDVHTDLNVMDCPVKDEPDEPTVKNADVLGPGSPVATETSPHDSPIKVAVMPPQSILCQPDIVARNHPVGFEVLLISEVSAIVANSHECASASEPVSSLKVASEEDAGQSFILIPKLWLVQRRMTEKGQNLIFVKLVTKRVSGIEVPVVEKTVVLAAGGLLHYFVYSRIVDTLEYKLDSVLSQLTSLPSILERFKNLSICVGIGDVNALHFSIDSAFRDCVDRWHAKDCTLLSKHKRCKGCIKMRTLVLARERKLKKNRPLVRMKKASNPIDQNKLLAQRRRLKNDRCSKNRAQRRVQLLKIRAKHNAQLLKIRAKHEAQLLKNRAKRHRQLLKQCIRP